MNILKMFLLGFKIVLRLIMLFFKYFFIGFYNILIILPKYFIIGLQTIFGKKEKKKRSIYEKKISSIMLGLSVFVYLICVFLISRWSVQRLKIRYLAEDIIDKTEIIEKQEEAEISLNDNDNDNNNDSSNDDSTQQPYYPSNNSYSGQSRFMSVDFTDLLNQNPDTVGWIKVDGTKVNYPVVQADDNDYYLTHAFNKNENIAGWVYADFRDDFTEFGKNTIIYGHNMNNKTMFGSVPSMLNNSYLANSNNYYIKISTPTSNSIWKLFSIYTIEPEVYYLKTTFYSEPFESFINVLKNRSIYDFGIDVTPDDKILTLSTCDNTGTKRVAVHAKMIDIEYR